MMGTTNESSALPFSHQPLVSAPIGQQPVGGSAPMGHQGEANQPFFRHQSLQPSGSSFRGHMNGGHDFMGGGQTQAPSMHQPGGTLNSAHEQGQGSGTPQQAVPGTIFPHADSLGRHPSQPQPQPSSRYAADGRFISRLLHIIELQRQRPEGNHMSFWREYVDACFDPQAKYRMDTWHSELERRTCSFEVTMKALPRVFKTKYDSGVIEELLYFDGAREVRVGNAMIIDCQATTIVTCYRESLVLTRGHARVVFSMQGKIFQWAFIASSHMEYVSRRDIVTRRTLPQSSICEYGVPHTVFRTFRIAEAVSQMRPEMSRYMSMLDSSLFPHNFFNCDDVPGMSNQQSLVQPGIGNSVGHGSSLPPQAPGSSEDVGSLTRSAGFGREKSQSTNKRQRGNQASKSSGKRTKKEKS